MYFTRVMLRPSYGTSSAPRIWPPVERCTQRTASETLRRDWRAFGLWRILLAVLRGGYGSNPMYGE